MLTAALIASASQNALAQGAPDLKMLLDLDLFTPPPSAKAPAQGSASANAPQAAPPSMLDQIRALNAMGYLGAPHNTMEIQPARNSHDDTQAQTPPPDDSENGENP